MPSGDTNPDLGRVFKEVCDMRQENKSEHKTITSTLNKHSIQLACLETKWNTFWKVVKYAGPVVGGVIAGVLAVVNLV